MSKKQPMERLLEELGNNGYLESLYLREEGCLRISVKGKVFDIKRGAGQEGFHVYRDEQNVFFFSETASLNDFIRGVRAAF